MFKEIATPRQDTRSTTLTITFGGPRYAPSYVTISNALRRFATETAQQMGIDNPMGYVLDVDGKLSFVIAPNGMASKNSSIPVTSGRGRVSRMALVDGIKAQLNVNSDKVRFKLDKDKMTKVEYDGQTIAVVPMDEYEVKEAFRRKRKNKSNAKQLELPFDKNTSDKQQQDTSDETDDEMTVYDDEQLAQEVPEGDPPIGDDDEDIMFDLV